MTETITNAIREHLATLSQRELLAAEHRAQIRLANANQGATRIGGLVRVGTLPQSSLDAANDERETAIHGVGLVHEAQSAEVRRQEAEAAAEAAEQVDLCDSPSTHDGCDHD